MRLATISAGPVTVLAIGARTPAEHLPIALKCTHVPAVGGEGRGAPETFHLHWTEPVRPGVVPELAELVTAPALD